jgi:hypothetical protein
MELSAKNDSVGFIEVDEFRTSKICSSCKSDKLNNVLDRDHEPKYMQY